MSTRSKLLLNVLRAWDQSVEGALYLDWLVESDPALDGGLVLREAVLEWNETEGPASAPVEKALAEFCARLSPGTASAVREKTVEMVAARSQIAQAIRESVRALRKLRLELGCGRLEALNQLAAELQCRAIDESQTSWKSIAAVRELAAKTAALRRTTAAFVDLEVEWQRVAADVPPPTPANQDTTEELDRYYSYQLVTRLEQIAERASALDPIQLKVASDPVKNLLQGRHTRFTSTALTSPALPCAGA